MTKATRNPRTLRKLKENKHPCNSVLVSIQGYISTKHIYIIKDINEDLQLQT